MILTRQETEARLAIRKLSRPIRSSDTKAGQRRASRFNRHTAVNQALMKEFGCE